MNYDELALTIPGGFASLGLEPPIVETLAQLGYEEPTPIQREAIPPLLRGRDLLGQAATGTGKTAAFALPMLQRIADAGGAAPRRPLALVLVPTRELAMQVAQAVHKYGKSRQATVLPIYGGQPFGQQLRTLDRGVEVVVATPGRALDHLDRGTMLLDDVRMLVLDEADEMLDMGFAEDLESILSRLPESQQTALFSATLPPRILAIAETHLTDPVRIAIAQERTASGAIPRVRQTAYLVIRANKHAALGRVLDMEAPTSAIVFCRTRIEVDQLAEAMNSRGYRAEALHGGFAQEQRDRTMSRFRNGKTDLLIATDVAARGLDIEHVSHVINFDVPTEPEAYVHRIGRTGRAGREGVAITFVEPREQRLLRNIQQATKQKIDMSTLPTVADLRHRRLAITRAALREELVAPAGDDDSSRLDRFHTLVSELANEFDPMDVAAAAVKLAHEATHAENDAHEKEVSLDAVATRSGGFSGDGKGRAPGGKFDRRHDRAAGGEARPWERGESAQRGRDHGGKPGFESTKIFISAGRLESIRPGDLVGAITNEANLTNEVIGAIQIADKFSLVEVRAEHAQRIIKALRGTKLRGRKVTVRLDRGPSEQA